MGRGLPATKGMSSFLLLMSACRSQGCGGDGGPEGQDSQHRLADTQVPMEPGEREGCLPGSRLTGDPQVRARVEVGVGTVLSLWGRPLPAAWAWQLSCSIALALARCVLPGDARCCCCCGRGSSLSLLPAPWVMAPDYGGDTCGPRTTGFVAERALDGTGALGPCNTPLRGPPVESRLGSHSGGFRKLLPGRPCSWDPI